mmetsp:Transcript_124128/g.215168  ORF Transcript_124128/g.215168 Transcript_124128/m.215168 type:complete len:81 (-) Transcript_124128:83-325(-)
MRLGIEDHENNPEQQPRTPKDRDNVGQTAERGFMTPFCPCHGGPTPSTTGDSNIPGLWETQGKPAGTGRPEVSVCKVCAR